MNMKEDEELLKYISRIYSDSHKKNMMYSKYQNNTTDNDNAILDFINEVLKMLSKEYADIILNEYLLKNTNINKSGDKWYLEYYSQSTFQRVKIKAVKEFLKCVKL